MALLLVLLSTILAFSLGSTDQCVSSPGSRIDLTLRSHKNASGDWIITVDTRRLRRKDNPREFSVNIQQETRICGRYKIEEHVSMAFVYPSSHDTSMPGAIEPSSTRPPTTTTATPSSGTLSTTTATPSASTTTTTTTTATPSTTTTTSTTTPKSCPHPGYQPIPGFNCYKAFSSKGEWKTWSEARAMCRGDGGDLMVIESEREREDVYVPLYNSVEWSYPWVWLGVYNAGVGYDWTTVNGDPARSTWWEPGEPEKNDAYKCAYAASTDLLGNNNCVVTLPFICEISP